MKCGAGRGWLVCGGCCSDWFSHTVSFINRWCKTARCHSIISCVVAAFHSALLWTVCGHVDCYKAFSQPSPLCLPPPDGVSGLNPCSSSSPPPRARRQQRHLVSLRADHGSHALSSCEHSRRRAGDRAGVPGTLWAGNQRQPGGHRVAGDWGRWD